MFINVVNGEKHSFYIKENNYIHFIYIHDIIQYCTNIAICTDTRLTNRVHDRYC